MIHLGNHFYRPASPNRLSTETILDGKRIRPRRIAGARKGIFLVAAIPFSLMLSATSAGYDGSLLEEGMQIAGLLVLLLVAALTTGRRLMEAPLYAESKTSALLVILLFCAASVSSVFAEDKLLSFSYVGGIAVTFLICGAVWNLPAEQVLTSLKLYAVATALWALGVWLVTPDVGRRFAAVVHPNYWGLLCLSVFCLAFLIRNVLFRTALQSISVAIILLAESRSALLSILVACVVLAYCRFQSARIGKDSKVALLAAMAFLGLVTVAVAHQEIYDLFSKVFKVNDPFRGASSGFTGRTAVWRAGLDVFGAYPWFGVGARMESNFISVAGFHHAHNGYINMLVQFGAIGGGIFLVLSALAFRRLLRLALRRAPGGSVGIAFVCAYAVGAIFDPKLINIGNPVSIIAIMFLLRPVGLPPVVARNPVVPRRPVGLRTAVRERRYVLYGN